ncbi:MAG: DHH family phosphoesterase [Candidatus Aenigmatarchaeota archaeon]
MQKQREKKLLIIDHHVPDLNLNKFKDVKLEDAIRFLGSINKEDKIGLLYHKDGDGVCSGVLIYKLLNLTGLRIKLRRACDPALSKKIIEEIKDLNVLIACDLPLDQRIKDKTLEGWEDAYCVHINSRFMNVEQPSKYCATILAYNLFSAHSHLSLQKWEWLIYGALCDFSNYINLKVNDKAFLFEKIITSYAHAGKNPDLIFDALVVADEIDEIIEGKNLFSYTVLRELEEINEEKDKLLMDVKESINSGKPTGKVKDIVTLGSGEKMAVILEVETDKSILSDVINVISIERKDDLIVFIKEKDKGENKEVEIKLRCQSGRMKCNEIAKEIASKFNGKGGGHPEAAGANLKSNICDVKRELLRIVGL